MKQKIAIGFSRETYPKIKINGTDIVATVKTIDFVFGKIIAWFFDDDKSIRTCTYNISEIEWLDEDETEPAQPAPAKTAEEILDKYLPCDTYSGGHPIQKYHDNENCVKCKYESDILKAMEEYKNQPTPAPVEGEQLPSEQEVKSKVLQGQSEIISGYIAKIDLDKLDIETVRDMLSHDFNFLHQEFALLQAENILNEQTPKKQ